jgi:hypothetical protein
LATFREFAKGGGTGTEGGETRRRSILCSLNQRHHLALFDRVVHIEDGVAVVRDPPRQSAEDAAKSAADSAVSAAEAAKAAAAEAQEQKPQ